MYISLVHSINVLRNEVTHYSIDLFYMASYSNKDVFPLRHNSNKIRLFPAFTPPTVTPSPESSFCSYHADGVTIMLILSRLGY